MRNEQRRKWNYFFLHPHESFKLYSFPKDGALMNKTEDKICVLSYFSSNEKNSLKKLRGEAAGKFTR